MKKQYQEPTVIVQKIILCKLICSSITGIAGIDGLGISDDETGEAGIITGNSRRGIWDDDEENEY